MKPCLLIYEYRVIGDAIMALPFIRSAKKLYNVHVACTDHTLEIYKQLLPISNIHPWKPPWFEKKNIIRNWFNSDNRKYIKTLQTLNPKIAVCAWADTRTHYVMAKSNAYKRIGFPMVKNNVLGKNLKYRKRHILIGRLLNILLSLKLIKPLLTSKLYRHNYDQHHIEDWSQIAQHLNIEWDETKPWFNIDRFQPSKKIIKLLSNDLFTNRKKWVVHPGARLEERRWPQEMFAKAIQEILLPNEIQPIIVEPPNFVLSDHLKQLAPVIKTKNLYDLLCLLTRVDGVLCNDTAISHAAAAINIPVVTIFTAGNPSWFSPRGNENNVVRKDVCSYHPCLDNCVMPSVICRDEISINDVNEKVLSVIGK